MWWWTAIEIFLAAAASGAAGVFGAIYGFRTAKQLRAAGEERVFISKWQLLYRGRGESGTPIDVPPREAEFVQFFFTADLFTTRDEPTGLRDIAVEFVTDGETRLSVVPADANSLKVGAMREDIQDVDVINLLPHQWSHWKFRRNVWGEDVKNVIEAEHVFFSATDPEGVRHRFPIADMPRGTLRF